MLLLLGNLILVTLRGDCRAIRRWPYWGSGKIAEGKIPNAKRPNAKEISTPNFQPLAVWNFGRLAFEIYVE
jgi:hypothetical protein